MTADIKQIEREYKQSTLDIPHDVLQAVEALMAIGYSEQGAYDLVFQWDEEEDAQEPQLYRFYLYVRDGYWRSSFEDGFPRLTNVFLDEFIADNQPKLIELWERLTAFQVADTQNDWPRMLEVWWDEGDAEAEVT